MTYIVVLLVVLAIVALYIRNQKSRTGAQTAETGSGPLPYMKKDYLLTRAERAFYDVLLIALGGRSHDIEERQERDTFIDKVFEAAGLKLLHVRAAISYDPQAIKTMIGIPS